MKKLCTATLAAALLAVSIPSLSTTAEAGGWGHHGGWGGGGWGGAGFGLSQTPLICIEACAADEPKTMCN